jgi:hypothetical protein
MISWSKPKHNELTSLPYFYQNCLNSHTYQNSKLVNFSVNNKLLGIHYQIKQGGYCPQCAHLNTKC